MNEQKLTTNEKKALANFPRWQNSCNYDLFDVYGSCSTAKRNAWRHCEDLCREFNGWGLKVVSFNTNMFTAGFVFEDPETGEVMYMHITPSYEAAVLQPVQ